MPRIVITEFMDPEIAEELTRAIGGVYDPSLVERREELKRLLFDCRALLVRNLTRVDADLLDSAPRLRVVGRLGVGLDNIDLDACRERGVEVRSAIGTNHVSVAEYVIGAMVLLSRPLFFASSAVAEGRWPRTRLSPGREISGRTLGLVGFGLTGRTLAIRARAMGMHVQAFDPHIAAEDVAWAEYGVISRPLDDLLETSEVLSIHVPLSPETAGLIGAAAIARLPKGALLINSARGGVVEEAAVVEALRSGQLGGAALDVFAQEPLPPGNVFRDVPNLILSPHLAGITRESAYRISQVVAEAVREVLQE
ncbi:NAD(P)-dependent oxidoreductase [Enterovirga rhinocerotis]|uniref:(S)-sulfolactate dehydrogenase n=1 Tax=Enterovirga rhinocerotis TaxID=1339210 RepID=A0A4R7BPJ3_9HYPH|nr:NAD(P)-dependent oxidoreductase [Enterovirga rhinocerotis]TDR87291.1 (S)-sulfolactate dehydrogenase [Enterovirga rhinocerotis]